MAISIIAQPVNGAPFGEWENSDLAKRLSVIFDNPQILGLIEDLEATRQTGRPGYPISVMVKTVLAGFVLNIPTDTGLIRGLGDNPLLSHLCGIFHPDEIPSPWAYSRFRKKLLTNREHVLGRMAALVSDLGEVIPGFGETVAIDSTVMHAYSNGRESVKATQMLLGRLSEDETDIRNGGLVTKAI